MEETTSKIETQSKLEEELQLLKQENKTLKRRLAAFGKDTLNQVDKMLLEDVQYTVLFEKLNMGILFVGLDTTMLYANQYFCDMLGYEREDLISNTSLDVLLADETDSSSIRERIMKRVKGEYEQYELKLKKKNKEVIISRVAASPVYNKAGEVIGSVGVHTDITEEKKAEELLKHRVELEDIIITVSANFINISPEKIDEEINESIRYIGRFLGADQAYIFKTNEANTSLHVSHQWRSSGLPEEPGFSQVFNMRRNRWEFKQINTYGVLSVPQLKCLPKEGANLKALLKQRGIKSFMAIPIIYRGSFTGAMALASTRQEAFWNEDLIPLFKILGQVYANALERKQVEEHLKQQEEMYRTLATNIPNSTVLLFDRKLRYILVEGAPLNEQEFLTHQVEGKSVEEVLPEAAANTFIPLYKLALKGEHAIVERTLGDKNYLVHILPVKNKRGRIYSGMVMYLDVTDMKAVQRKLEEYTEELQRSNEDLEQFAYAASHDLQEPLRMVASYVNLIERRLGAQLTGDVSEFMFYATDGVKRMQELINDLLEYSRVDRHDSNYGVVDMNMVLEMVCANLERRIEDTGTTVIFDDLPEVKADQYQMVSLMQNLVENAIKFKGKEPAVILVEHQGKRGKWLFSVKDNGIGIENKYFDRIFTIFQRLNSRTEYTGTGIGLAICKKIVERHGGRMWVESELGSGTTFYFEIKR